MFNIASVGRNGPLINPTGFFEKFGGGVAITCRNLSSYLIQQTPKYEKLFSFLELKGSEKLGISSEVELFLKEFIIQLNKSLINIGEGSKKVHIKIDMDEKGIKDFFDPLAQNCVKKLEEDYGIKSYFLSSHEIPSNYELGDQIKPDETVFFIAYHIDRDVDPENKEYHAIPIFYKNDSYYFPLESSDLPNSSVMKEITNNIISKNKKCYTNFLPEEINRKLYPTNFLCVAQSYSVLRNIAEALKNDSLFLQEFDNRFFSINPGVYSGLQSNTAFERLRNDFNSLCQKNGVSNEYKEKRTSGFNKNSIEYSLFYLHAKMLPYSLDLKENTGVGKMHSFSLTPLACFIKTLGKKYPEVMKETLNGMNPYFDEYLKAQKASSVMTQ